MLHCLEEVFSFSHKRDQWYRLVFLFALLSVTYLVSGCRSTTSQELYENAKFGVRLEKPGNWRLSLNERSGSIVLEPESGNGLKDSARIEIYGYACVPTLSHNTNETLESNIERIRTLYNLDSVTIIQPPIQVETGDNEITKATIRIPTMSLSEDSAKNQVGDRGPDIFQTIDMVAIRDRNNHSIMVYLYKGNSEELNAEAEAIADSIQLTCAATP